MPVIVGRVGAESLHVVKPTWWLEGRLHIKLGHEPGFGALCLVNDDLVQPSSGFGQHPHRDMEIFSYIIDGELSHADSMGNKEALPRGCVQYLSAGTGITHSEMNDHPTETSRFLQIWFVPDRRGHKPNYGSTRYQNEDRHNKLLQIFGGTGGAPAWPEVSVPTAPIKFNQDANIYVSEADAGKSFDLSLGPDRQAYMVCIEGSLKVNDVSLGMRDGARLLGDAASGQAAPLRVSAGEGGAHFLLMEMQRKEAEILY